MLVKIELILYKECIKSSMLDLMGILFRELNESTGRSKARSGL